MLFLTSKRLFNDRFFVLKIILLLCLQMEQLCFIRACEEGILNDVIYLVKNGINIRVKSDEGFRDACSYGHLEISKYLMTLRIN